jgi:hypothetical protein
VGGEPEKLQGSGGTQFTTPGHLPIRASLQIAARTSEQGEECVEQGPKLCPARTSGMNGSSGVSRSVGHTSRLSCSTRLQPKHGLKCVSVRQRAAWTEFRQSLPAAGPAQTRRPLTTGTARLAEGSRCPRVGAAAVPAS